MITPLEAKSIGSIISGRLKVKVEPGSAWKYDHDTKTVNYRVEDLSLVDEQDVIANLLHECGHAKYSTNPSLLDYEFIVKDCDGKDDTFIKNVKSNFFKLVNLVEDFREEDLVRKSYPFATEYLPEYSFKTLWEMNNVSKKFINDKGEKPPKYIQYLLGTYTALGQYVTSLTEKVDEDVAEVIEKTICFARKARTAKNTEDLLKVLENIYPYIKDWIKDMDGSKTSLLQACYIPHFGGEEGITYAQLYSDVKQLINPLVMILRKTLTDNFFNRLAGRHRTGKGIDNRVLYKTRLGQDKIFTRVEEAKAKDYAVTLLVDESGSMDHKDKNLNAARAAVLFGNALDKLDIPFSLFGFNSGIRCYKKLNEKLAPKHYPGFESCYNNSRTRYDDIENDFRYNSDGYAVRTAGESMNQCKSKKILIVMSDGIPEDSRNHRESLPDAIKKVEKSGVLVFGVGIGSYEGVRSFYSNSVTVSNVSELPKTLGKILIKALKSKPYKAV